MMGKASYPLYILLVMYLFRIVPSYIYFLLYTLIWLIIAESFLSLVQLYVCALGTNVYRPYQG